MNYYRIQRRLKELGFDPGPIDGMYGPKTEKAIIDFKKSVGLRDRPYVGPITMNALFKDEDPCDNPSTPWINEVNRYMGLHERRDYNKLFSWLRSDRMSVGDPRKFPWCGDLVETAIKLTLPNEPFKGRVKENPYLARNWLDFGIPCEPLYGAIVVFWRGRRNGISGHVGFAVGRDAGKILVRGGNQSNSVNDSWLSSSRLLGYRFPITYSGPRLPLPRTSSSGSRISTNEA